MLYSIALKYFVFPSKVILTGTEGIASSLYYYFENYWLFIVIYAIFQTSLLTFAFFKISRVFAIRSFAVICVVIIMLAFLPELRFAEPEPQNERIILVLFGGILAGVAKALAFTNRGSTGDEDIPGAYFAIKYLKPVGSIAVFAAVGSTTFGLLMDFIKNGEFESIVNTLMYTCIYIFASVETLNNLYRKFKLTMLVVITSKQEEIGTAIRSVNEHRTYTLDEGTGGHSGKLFSVVKTIITQEELAQMIDTIENSDPNCFYYYHDIEGIYGRYYIAPFS